MDLRVEESDPLKQGLKRDENEGQWTIYWC